MGDLRDRGWVLLITDAVVLLPEAPLRRPYRRPADESLPGQPLPTADPPGVPELPAVLGPRRRDRAIGALQLLGWIAGPAFVLSGLADGWFPTIVVLWGAGILGFDGWARLNGRVTLTREAVLVHDRMRTHRVPWQRMHGVRQDGDRLWLAWDPDRVVQVGPFAAGAEHWGAVMMGLRAGAAPGGEVTSRVGSGVAVAAAYALVAIAAAWWQFA